MIKGNQKSQKERDIAIVNERYDIIIKTLGEYADASEKLMPLLSDILRLGQKMAKLYKQGFNAGIKHAK